MIKAVIDIGTNTFHLLIAEIDTQGKIKVIHKNTIPVKLGEGGVNKGFISPQAYQRGLNALIQFREELNTHHIKDVKATATAAVRDAANGKEFVAEALAKADIKISIIDGLKEAELIYLGAKAAEMLNQKTSLIMDIGGGSTEFIICNENEILWKNSYRLGAARLLADFYHEDPISTQTIKAIHQHFSIQLPELFSKLKEHKVSTLIGTAGSFNTYAELIAINNHQVFDANTMQRFNFNFDDFNDLLNQLITSTHQQRANMKGLIPLRVDMILMASILTEYVLKQSAIQEITTCTYSLKEGLLISDWEL
ncbi:exopolyphosphatase [Pelobium sp.]|nr:exopolyphosphatase [Pelobium sp.]MDA9554737.1 exopolyphosphatase [Pelobium sp.]